MNDFLSHKYCSIYDYSKTIVIEIILKNFKNILKGQANLFARPFILILSLIFSSLI